jgi:endonuclease/exonuclease/phosphatase family metal-dependent hydrolase
MLNFLRLCAALLLVPACIEANAEEPSAARPIRVATYNIHNGGRGMDNKYDLHRIARVLAEQKPDVVFLQEVDVQVGRSGNQDTGAIIAKDLGMNCVFGQAIPLGRGAYGVAILSRWPMKKLDQMALTGAHVSEARTALFVESEIPADATHPAKPVLLVGTHLDHLKSAEAEITEHARRIVERIKAENRFTLFGGDFNAEPSSPIVQAIATQLGHAEKTPPVKTCPADVPTEEIDHLFWHPTGAAESRAYVVLPEKVASDHRPVIMDLLVK